MFVTQRVICVSLFAIALMASGGRAQPAKPSETSQGRSLLNRVRHAENTIRRLKSRHEPMDIFLARDVADELNGILRNEPNTPLRPRIEQDLDSVDEILAWHDLQVASAYMQWHPRRFPQAESRLIDITQKYRKFSKMDEVFFRLGVIALQTEHPDDAARYLCTLAINYRTSEYLEFALRELNRIGKSTANCGP